MYYPSVVILPIFYMFFYLMGPLSCIFDVVMGFELVVNPIEWYSTNSGKLLSNLEPELKDFILYILQVFGFLQMAMGVASFFLNGFLLGGGSLLIGYSAIPSTYKLFNNTDFVSGVIDALGITISTLNIIFSIMRLGVVGIGIYIVVL